MADICDTPYAGFLEESLKIISENNPERMCYVAIMQDGAVLTSYYNANATDKAVFANNIQSDVVMDIVMNNIDTIKAALYEDEESEGEDGA